MKSKTGADTGGRSVAYADVIATLLEVSVESASSIREKCDGISFHVSIMDRSSSRREYVCGLHNNYPERLPCPIRSIGEGTYGLFINLAPQNDYVEKRLMGMADCDQIERKYWTT